MFILSFFCKSCQLLLWMLVLVLFLSGWLPVYLLPFLVALNLQLNGNSPLGHHLLVGWQPFFLYGALDLFAVPFVVWPPVGRSVRQPRRSDIYMYIHIYGISTYMLFYVGQLWPLVPPVAFDSCPTNTAAPASACRTPVCVLLKVQQQQLNIKGTQNILIGFQLASVTRWRTYYQKKISKQFWKRKSRL